MLADRGLDREPEVDMAAWLVALTADAREALHGEQRVIERFPFKVGRESRIGSERPWRATERRSGSVPHLNDLYIVEKGELLNVSREHFLIEQDGGRYFLVDRGSACGTIVEGRTVGGDRRGGRVELHDHDVIIVGTPASPFVFKFRTA
jgi:pSer/pThr/pTyr-binding forkhead associated (FHA) protein